MFCVYIIIYCGNRMPPFYIGSTNVSKFLSGYRGSIKSKKFQTLWAEELLASPHLFTSHLLLECDTRAEALKLELQCQIALNVVRSEYFVNESYAQPKGYCGREVSGEANPMFGRSHKQNSKDQISKNHADVSGSNNPMFGKPGPRGMLNKHHTTLAKNKMLAKQWDRSGAKNPMYGKKAEHHPAFGFKHNPETIAAMKLPKPVVLCPHCGTEGGKPAMARFHFDKCKTLSS